LVTHEVNGLEIRRRLHMRTLDGAAVREAAR
jgi:hypothetical protein